MTKNIYIKGIFKEKQIQQNIDVISIIVNQLLETVYNQENISYINLLRKTPFWCLMQMYMLLFCCCCCEALW